MREPLMLSNIRLLSIMSAFTSFSLKPFDTERFTFSDAENTYFDFYHINFSQVNDCPIRHNFGYLILDSFSIATHFYSSREFSKTVVVNHGYMDHSGLYTHLIKALLAAKFNVLIYDHPGHGLSSGEKAGIQSYQDFQSVLSSLLNKLGSHLPKPWYVVGQSMGGAISADFVLHDEQHTFEKCVLLAPLVTPLHWSTIKLQFQGLKHLVSGVPRKFRDSSLDRDFLHFLETDDTLQTKQVKTSWVKALIEWQDHLLASYPSEIPTLLIQGDNDNTIDWRYGLEVYREKFTELDILMLASANHHLVCETPVLREQALRALVDFLS